MSLARRYLGGTVTPERNFGCRDSGSVPRYFGTAQPTPGIYFLTCATLKRVFFISQHIMADLLIYPAFISQFTDHKIATEVLTGLMPTLDNMPIIPLLDNLHSSLF